MKIVFDKRTEATAEIFGESHKFFMPNVMQHGDYEDGIVGKDGKEIYQLTYNYLDSLGIPKESTKKLELDQLLELVRFISMGGKKK